MTQTTLILLENLLKDFHAEIAEQYVLHPGEETIFRAQKIVAQWRKERAQAAAERSKG